MRILLPILFACSVLFAGNGISINGSPNGCDVEQGLPVMLSVTTVGAGPAPAEKLEATGPDGAQATLWHRAAASGEVNIGDKVVSRTDVWTLAPEDSASLPVGKYNVRIANEQDAFFVITVPGNNDSAQARAARLLLLSAHAELAGDNAKALEAATQLVTDQPDSVAGKLRLSDLLADGGRLEEALRLLREAEILVTEGKRLPHPPVMIRIRQAEILERMTER